MDLTDILLFGETIIGDGGASGGSIPVIDLTHLNFNENDGVATLSAKDCEKVVNAIDEMMTTGTANPVMVVVQHSDCVIAVVCHSMFDGVNGMFMLNGAVNIGMVEIGLSVQALDVGGVARMTATENAGGGVTVVDLSEFHVSGGSGSSYGTINNIVLMLMQLSIQNGAMERFSVNLPDSALRDACNTNRQLIKILIDDDDEVFVPVSVNLLDGRTSQISASCMMMLAGVGVVETKVLFTFFSDTTLDIYLKAEVSPFI